MVTGTLPSGTLDSEGDCNGWTNSAAVRTPGTVGLTAGGPPTFVWSSRSGYNCAAQNTRIYCVQTFTGSTLPLPSVPPLAKRVFVTQLPYRPGGLDGTPDAFCNTQKPTGVASYKALVASIGNSPAVNAGVVLTTQYHRVDGALVGNGEEIIATQLRNGIWYTGNGTSVQSAFLQVWGGLPQSPVVPGTGIAGTIATTCNNWTSADAGLFAGTGYLNSANRDFIGGPNTTACSSTNVRLYCVEQ